VDLFIIADDLVRYRDRKKEIEEALKEINALITETEEQLVSAMVEEEMQNFTRNGRQFILTNRTYANAKAGMMPAICDWMKGHELGDMVKESVHPQTLQAWVKEQIEEVGALPEDLSELVNVYEKSGISIRKK
jgi:pyrroloquinoline quinone (PQQ) biosynthesis protein C